MDHILHSNISEQLSQGDKKNKKNSNNIKILIRKIQHGY